MKLAVLFSGGKDSTYAALIAKRQGHEISCLLTVESENENSFMFHTPSIKLTTDQAEVMNIPLVTKKTLGKKEAELKDLRALIKEAIKKFKIEGIVTGAVESVYQASRIQNICNSLNLECFNPLWQKEQSALIKELIREKFEIVISSVAAYPLEEKWVGRKVDDEFIKDLRKISENLKINPAGEGGEFESFVTNCPLFKKRLVIKEIKKIGEGNSWRGEIVLE